MNKNTIKTLNNKLALNFKIEINEHIFIKERLHDKIKLLQKITSNKNVLHIGFADHISVIEEKINKNLWLHAKIVESSNRCIGIDVNKDAIDLINKITNYENYCIDIEDKREISNIIDILETNSISTILVPEVLEHLRNPGKFLDALYFICSSYRQNVNLVVTVPNAFYFEKFKYAKKGIEIGNNDHKFHFSPKTLTRLMLESKFILNDMYFSSPQPTNTLQLLKYCLKNPIKILLGRKMGLIGQSIIADFKIAS